MTSFLSIGCIRRRHKYSRHPTQGMYQKLKEIAWMDMDAEIPWGKLILIKLCSLYVQLKGFQIDWFQRCRGPHFVLTYTSSCSVTHACVDLIQQRNKWQRTSDLIWLGGLLLNALLVLKPLVEKPPPFCANCTILPGSELVKCGVSAANEAESTKLIASKTYCRAAVFLLKC